MKKKCILMAALFSLVGCNPFGERQEQTKKFTEEADAVAEKVSDTYEIKLRQIKEYDSYTYKKDLEDPFRVRDFILDKLKEEEEAVVGVIKEKKQSCNPPECIPPQLHPTELLENYTLDKLSFVGTMNSSSDQGLVRVPEFGVVTVKVGGYMGKNFGKVLSIKKTAIILQEKIYKKGLWENKKTVLLITQ